MLGRGYPTKVPSVLLPSLFHTYIQLTCVNSCFICNVLVNPSCPSRGNKVIGNPFAGFRNGTLMKGRTVTGSLAWNKWTKSGATSRRLTAHFYDLVSNSSYDLVPLCHIVYYLEPPCFVAPSIQPGIYLTLVLSCPSEGLGWRMKLMCLVVLGLSVIVSGFVPRYDRNFSCCSQRNNTFCKLSACTGSPTWLHLLLFPLRAL